jgi:hypothetical protein
VHLKIENFLHFEMQYAQHVVQNIFLPFLKPTLAAAQAAAAEGLGALNVSPQAAAALALDAANTLLSL